MSRRRMRKQVQTAKELERKKSFVPIKTKSHRYNIAHPDDNKLPNLMALDTTGGKYVEKLMVQKLELCCLVYDFWDEMSNVRGKNVKTETLTELNTWVLKSKCVLNEMIISLMFKMISINLFRPIFYDQEITTNENLLTDEAWPHLSLVYKLFDTILNSRIIPMSILINYITGSFIVQLFKNFNSIDSNERSALKNITHKIYSKFLKFRNFIRQQINHIFLMYIYETDKMRGIKELLEIYGSIICGYVLPLKKEHLNFLNKVLIPLHIPPLLHLYFRELLFCLKQYIDKNGRLIKPILLGLLKYWPKTCSSKQLLFLNEVEDILDLIQPPEILLVYKPLFKKLAACATSDNFLIAQRALIMYANEYFTTLIEDNNKIIMPIMFPPLYRKSDNHWNSCIREFIKQVLAFYKEINFKLYEKLEKIEKLAIEINLIENEKK